MTRLQVETVRVALAAALLFAAGVAPVLAQDDAKPKPVTWKDGTTTFETEHLTINLTNRVQFRMTDEFPDDDVQAGGTAGPGDSKASFRVRRAKTRFSGTFWKPEFRYELQLSWAGPEAGASAQTALEDIQLTWDISKKRTFEVSAGQFKVPLGRQEMTSSGRMQFVDRDIFSFEFTRGRDIGVQVEGALAKGKLEYMAGVFNGNAAARLGNDNSKFQYNSRVVFQPWGSVGYSEGDFESTDKPLLALAGQVEHNNQAYTSNVSDNLRTVIFGGDVVFKYKGFSVFAEYLARDRKPQPFGNFDPASPPFDTVAYHSNGWHGQAGYFLKRDKLEAAVRYATYDPTDKISSNDRTEIGGGLNYFVNKHFFKVQMDVRQIENSDKTKNKELRIQSQVMF
jgi:phosphate-selective porin OprO/OprP